MIVSSFYRLCQLSHLTIAFDDEEDWLPTVASEIRNPERTKLDLYSGHGELKSAIATPMSE